jgi:integrase/recombinase XerC
MMRPKRGRLSNVALTDRNFDRAGREAGASARLMALVGELAGVGAVRPHGLYHAAITHALDVTGGNVRRVQRFSRHRDLHTLTVYDNNGRDLGGEEAALVAGGP